MRRDNASIQGLIGVQLKAEYDAQFADLKQKGLINRLENIAVRSIEIVDMGMESNEEYITMSFSRPIFSTIRLRNPAAASSRVTARTL